MNKRIAEAFANGKAFIPFLTCGDPSLEVTEQLIYAMEEAGADLIVGCHPHCLQGIDYMGDTPVIYSLGNFWFNSKEVDTALLKVTVQGDTLENIQMIPALQKDCSTNALDGAEGERVINYLQSLSENITIDAEGYISSY